MSESEVLQKIVENRRKHIEKRKASKPIDQNLAVSRRSLFEALKQPGLQFIMECKKASPSKGLIRENFDLNEIVTTYNRYACAISVLTEPEYFQGSDDDLAKVATLTTLPILCKDFIFDAYQVVNARAHGADAILLMLSVVDDDTYRKLAGVAKAYAMDVLTEVHTEEELERALALGATIIGINNRDLKTLKIDLATTQRLTAKIKAKQVEHELVIVSESGISQFSDVCEIRNLAQGALVGSSLMAADDLDRQCRQLKFGEVKICGLTNADAAVQAFNCGASYGGLIFHDASPRGISIDQAQVIQAAAPLQYVGVFVEQSVAEIVAMVNKLNLSVVQLHGQQDIQFIKMLRAELEQALPERKIALWSAQAHTQIENKAELKTLLDHCDKVLFDTKTDTVFGGSGESFDWSKLATLSDVSRIGLAGGLNPENIVEARRLFQGLLDVNSGVESASGEKDKEKITQLFKRLGEFQ